MENQAEVEAEFHDKEAKAAELKNKVQTAKHPRRNSSIKQALS